MSEVSILQKYKRYLMGISGVVGVGLEGKYIVVFVEKLTPELRAVIPMSLEGIPVKIIETGTLRILPALYGGLRTKKWRPVVAGVSVGHPDVTAGTLGGFVVRGGEIFGISNNHVVALNWGYKRVGKRGDPILQPGRYDGGTLKDKIGELYTWSDVILHKPNYLDVGIFKLTESWKDLILDVGIEPIEIREAKAGEGVIKSGRTSGLTSAKILAVHSVVRIHGYGIAEFDDQIITTAFMRPGDSGSLVLSDDGHFVVGLGFAGSYSISVVNPFTKIKKAFGVSPVIPKIKYSSFLSPLFFGSLLGSVYLYGKFGGGKP